MGAQGSERTTRPRIQTLSDLVFGLALSISALTLVGQQPATTQQFALALGLYGFSFLILISVWQLYSSVTSILPAETTALINLNVVLLFFVSIEPYLFNELFALSGDMELFVSGIYSIDLAAMFFILAYFLHALTNEERQLVPKSQLGRYRFDRDVTLLAAVMLTISIAPYFGDTIILGASSGGVSASLSLRSTVWLTALLIGWIKRIAIVLMGRRNRVV
jgi:uncharacterized membrane protein